MKRIITCLILVLTLLVFTACGTDITESLEKSSGSKSRTILTEQSIETSKTDDNNSSTTSSKETSTVKSTNSTITNSSVNSTTNSSQKSTVTSSSKSQETSSSKNTTLTKEQQETVTKALNAVDWQLENGGWGKTGDKTSTFNGYPSDYCWKVNGKFVGTIDNKSTYPEMRLLAEAYDLKPDKKLKDSFDKALQFLKNLQYPSGGFSQIYPHNGKYNDHVTFNDGAMVSVLNLLQDIAQNKTPFKNIVDDSERAVCQQMIDKAVDYIIKAQLTVKGEKAAWCAQHNPTTYAPELARSYELPSVSGSESVGVIQFLLTQTNNQKALDAAESARLWLKARAMKDTTYSKRNPPSFFSEKAGSYCWYRFYDLQTGEGYFCDRDGKTYTDIDEFYKAAPERATGYDWAGSWLQRAGLYY